MVNIDETWFPVHSTHLQQPIDRLRRPFQQSLYRRYTFPVYDLPDYDDMHELSDYDDLDDLPELISWSESDDGEFVYSVVG
jgi:hypothetical protein